jgi:hypothetical protein
MTLALVAIGLVILFSRRSTFTGAGGNGTMPAGDSGSSAPEPTNQTPTDGQAPGPGSNGQTPPSNTPTMDFDPSILPCASGAYAGVIVKAKNSLTGAYAIFPDRCSVPLGWELCVPSLGNCPPLPVPPPGTPVNPQYPFIPAPPIIDYGYPEPYKGDGSLAGQETRGGSILDPDTGLPMTFEDLPFIGF